MVKNLFIGIKRLTGPGHPPGRPQSENLLSCEYIGDQVMAYLWLC